MRSIEIIDNVFNKISTVLCPYVWKSCAFCFVYLFVPFAIFVFISHCTLTLKQVTLFIYFRNRKIWNERSAVFMYENAFILQTSQSIDMRAQPVISQWLNSKSANILNYVDFILLVNYQMPSKYFQYEKKRRAHISWKMWEQVSMKVECVFQVGAFLWLGDTENLNFARISIHFRFKQMMKTNKMPNGVYWKYCEIESENTAELIHSISQARDLIRLPEQEAFVRLFVCLSLILSWSFGRSFGRSVSRSVGRSVVRSIGWHAK